MATLNLIPPTPAPGDTLIGSKFDDTLFGGVNDDLLIGQDGDDVLDGRGGVDTMEGGEGNDFYYVREAGDVVREVAGGGVDIVLSSVSYALGDHFETLRLDGKAYSAAGNDRANDLQGTANANLLDGGAGADTMRGFSGDDIYYVDNIGDRVVEAPDGGYDTVRSTISERLAPDVEALELIGGGAINGRGNDGSNSLLGNAKSNELYGDGGGDLIRGGQGGDLLKGQAGADTLDGGLGVDTLYGGKDADAFLFLDAPKLKSADLVMDFHRNQGDRLILDAGDFGDLSNPGDLTGTLDPARFVLRPRAIEEDDRIVYDMDSGRLSYDPDGVGGAQQITFAMLEPGTKLTAADILITGDDALI